LVIEPSVTSVVSNVSSAINYLLFREDGGLSVLDEVKGFQGGDGSEGVARSARSLVLNWSECSLGDPIN